VLLGVVSAAALAACAKIGDDVIDHDSLAFDRAVREWTLANQRPRIRQAFGVATHVGAPSVVVPIALLAAAWLWRRQRLPIAAAMVTAPAVASGLFNAVKHTYKRQRPAGAALTRHRTHSFPSGHATTSAAVLGALAYVLWREKMLPAPAAATLGIVPPVAIGASRVYLDVHWATDVLGGWSVGALVATLGAAVYERVRRNTRERGELARG
jgi:undecaprenyl-diphosphatase